MIARRVPLPALQLRSGVVIADPLADAYRFIEVDGTYQRYDQAVGGGDDEVTEADVHIANQIIARMGPRETTAILSRAERLHSALGVLPVTTTLVNPPQEIPWSAIEDLYDAMSGLPGIGLARATKVLHKKRPSLIPILDEVVQRYLAAVDRPISGSLAARGVSLTRSYQRELLHQLPILQLISSRLIEDGYFLTECRLLDIYLWAYSGMSLYGSEATPDVRRADSCRHTREVQGHVQNP